MLDSQLVGQTLRSLDFRRAHNLTVLAINRHGQNFVEKLSDVMLEFGDVLLVQGRRRRVEPLVVDGEILLLEDLSQGAMRTEKRPWALAAFGLFLALSLSKVVIGFDVPLAIAVLLGVLLLLATKTVRYAELYSLIDFRLLVLIACMMSFGVAMEQTKTDVFLADLIVRYFDYGARAERYSHRLDRGYDLTQAQAALIALLLLRGPQTLNELLTRSDRLHRFADIGAVRHTLDRLSERSLPLVVRLPRASGQREDRYAHRLCGEPEYIPSRTEANSNTHSHDASRDACSRGWKHWKRACKRWKRCSTAAPRRVNRDR